MKFLNPKEWQVWCTERDVPLVYRMWMRPNVAVEPFHIVDIPYQKDSGAKVDMAKQLFSMIESESESLLLVDDWAVWPSCQHMPLFTRFRQALGEIRPLIQAPGHTIASGDRDDAVSIIAMSLLFIWDCYGISACGQNAFYFSHDEYCFFASRDHDVARRVTVELSESE